MWQLCRAFLLPELLFEGDRPWEQMPLLPHSSPSLRLGTTPVPLSNMESTFNEPDCMQAKDLVCQLRCRYRGCGRAARRSPWQVLHVGKDIPVTLALRQLIEKSFPEEYQQRRQEEQAAADMSDSGEAPLPLFVMSCCLPSELCCPLCLTRLLLLLLLLGAAPSLALADCVC